MPKSNKTKLKLIFLCAFYTVILPWDMEQIIATSTHAFFTALKANDKYIHSLGISIWLYNRIFNQLMVYNLDSAYCVFIASETNPLFLISLFRWRTLYLILVNDQFYHQFFNIINLIFLFKCYYYGSFITFWSFVY